MIIACWSGPRNLSTAMMYSFGNRSDFEAWDEPFYGAFLAATRIQHPMSEQVLATSQIDPFQVSRDCVTTTDKHRYLKLMTHHMVSGFPVDWAKDCVNVHLIRHPARVISSYLLKRENPTLDDLGFERQVELFEKFPGPVIDSFEVRQDPGGTLERLCAEIGLPWSEDMLRWPAGPKPFDGVWADHWYGSVHQSTGFAGAEADLPALTHPLIDQALPHYEVMKNASRSK